MHIYTERERESVCVPGQGTATQCLKLLAAQTKLLLEFKTRILNIDNILDVWTVWLLYQRIAPMDILCTWVLGWLSSQRPSSRL